MDRTRPFWRLAPREVAAATFLVAVTLGGWQGDLFLQIALALGMVLVGYRYALGRPVDWTGGPRGWVRARRWDLSWRGQRIEVHYAWDLRMRVRRALIINGTLADAYEGPLGYYHGLQGMLGIPGLEHHVTVALGRIGWKLRPGCHIFIDGRLLGGDVDKQLLPIQPSVCARMTGNDEAQ